MYLLGEMEWALERDWKPGQSPLSYTREHYHHCDGWIGTDLREENAPKGVGEHYALFCYGGGESPLIPVRKLDYSPGSISQLLVNVAYEQVKPSRPLWIVLRRRPDTALPRNYSDLVSYGVRVAKMVRQMYEAALLRYAERQHAILLGRAQVSHDFSFTIRTTLSDVRELAEAVDSLRRSESLYPLNSFSQLPQKLRSFTYPARLYAVALSSACKYEHDDKTFLRQIPHIDWIARSISKDGISTSLVSQISEYIAKPLAKGSLEQFDQDSSKVVKASPVTTGAISTQRLQQLGKIQVSLLVSVIIELLREAFQHGLDDSPDVDVVLSESPQINIAITNSCKPDAKWEQASNGNQATTLDALMRRLPQWTLTSPNPATGKWTRSIILRTETEQ